MTDPKPDVKCGPECATTGCPCLCDTCTGTVELTKETAALVAEFSNRELG
jgi:hypothetical protein